MNLTHEKDMRKRRRFYRGAVNHIYQRTADGGILFYCLEDYIVFFTIFSVCARSSADIQVLALCLMYDHFHLLLRTSDIQKLSDFMERTTSWFAREYNLQVGRKGRLFQKNFGSAPKWDDKSVISAINYVGNNPVEKRLCLKAEEYRWGFLPYAVSQNPFSEKIVLRKASHRLRDAMKAVKMMSELNLPLKYGQLENLTRRLTEAEKEQLIDYIISTYLPFDYDDLISYYGSYETMLTAMSSNTGSEFDIKERNDRHPHVAYDEILAYLGRNMPRKDIRKLPMLPDSEKRALAEELLHNTSATELHVCKFLHIKRGS